MIKKHLPLFTFLLVLICFSFITGSVVKGAANHIVISQVQIGGSSATDEFIELFNPTENIVDLSGFRLSKKTSSGTLSNLLTTMSGVVPSNGYFLIKHTNYTGVVTADSQYSTGNSITADNTIVLYSDAGSTVIDMVGYGTPFESETLPFPQNPGAGQSIKRSANTDTDNNSVDFELLQISDPRNTGTSSATPTPSPTPEQTETPSPSPTATPTIEEAQTPTPTPTFLPEETATPLPVTPTPSSTPHTTPTPTPTSSYAPTNTPLSTHKPHKEEESHEIWLPFGFRYRFERHQFEFKKHRFSYYHPHFFRR